ncbi:MAG: Gfo/Idh/MocA family oxidoreductase [Anaerolineae bacterium]|nr:Gfo/Idh/MocA family oxidoreductase [Anaerolineae bacterium]
MINVAFVGCGRISDLHQLGYQGREDARILAVCDTDLRRAKQKASAWQVPKVYQHFEDVLGDAEIDLVELLVPHHLHCHMTIQALRAGKHVSLQKPMALTLQEADEMIAAAEESKKVFRVYENFVFYPPHVKAREMLQAGEIGEPQMLRMHVSTGKSKTEWKVPLSAWAWRFNEKLSGGGPLIFDHGYHLFSLAYDLMGPVKRVHAWMDRSMVRPGIYLDAPAVIMFQFQGSRKYGILDFAHTPNLVMDSIYYSDDDRAEIIGDRGILIINRCTAKTLDYPPLVLFRDGKTTEVHVDRYEWHDSFIDCTRHLLDVLANGGTAKLDGRTARNVLEFSIAAHQSAAVNHEIVLNQKAVKIDRK